jgi:uncharacterized membrane protein
MTQQPHPQRDEELLFDARLRPHRSLGPRGFVVLMAAVCGVSFVAGLVFFLIGAWPVVGFFGLDVALIYLAFRINYRRARMYETLRLTRRTLVVERVSHWGERRTWQLQPYWLQVLVDERPGEDGALMLRSHGRSLAVGAFLTAEERHDLARALRQALRRVRCVAQPVGPCAPEPA